MELAALVANATLAAGLSLAGVAALVLAVSAAVSLVRNDELSGSAKAMWIVAIALFPIFGPIVYFTVRSDW